MKKSTMTTQEIKEAIKYLKEHEIPWGTPLSEIILPQGLMVEDEIIWLEGEIKKIKEGIPWYEQTVDPVLQGVDVAIINIGIMMLRTYSTRLQELRGVNDK